MYFGEKILFSFAPVEPSSQLDDNVDLAIHDLSDPS